MKTANGHARDFFHPLTMEGARLTVNLDTFVVVSRKGSDGDDACVARPTNIQGARHAWAGYQSALLRAGFVRMGA